jgi:hypothetical protein
MLGHAQPSLYEAQTVMSHQREHLPGTVGRPIPGSTCRAIREVDETTRYCPQLGTGNFAGFAAMSNGQTE